MMPVTVRYRNGTAAVFSSVEDALAQARHDLCQPGHLDPHDILDGDRGEVHASWRAQVITARAQRFADELAAHQELPEAERERTGSPVAEQTPVPVVVDPPADVKVLHGAAAVAALVCECAECEFQREAPKLGLNAGAERQELLQRLKMERYSGERP